ncbi:hypothetical protein KMC50_gp44 [Ralstonia phage Claudette]|uniref:Uncharacterized protein n=2 Tax=Gervaisevirus claudettte TaxID=2846041 RepID=A0A7G5B865_9CAUD|nr:hypothetical protein KMC50_gp44 [Ralstonia phage Claudette]QMV32488.1 hypothetical protein 20A_00039 [Ralstonia phage Alix]QMV32751.1 hypothetical protein 20Ca_00044 [Ralstonia phage Claudette]UAW00992.1 hypothetical protein [Ralstonia phage RPZH3]
MNTAPAIINAAHPLGSVRNPVRIHATERQLGELVLGSVPRAVRRAAARAIRTRKPALILYLGRWRSIELHDGSVAPASKVGGAA